MLFGKYISYFGLFYILIIFCSCSQTPFHIDKTTHQRMVITNNMANTKIEVFIPEAIQDVNFTNIVFNKQQVPVTQKAWNKSGVRLSAVVQHGEKLILDQKQEMVNLPNQLQYEHEGKASFVLLKEIDFLPTKIAPKY